MPLADQITIEVWCACLQFVLSIHSAVCFSVVCKTWRRIVCSSMAWSDLRVDISQIYIPRALFPFLQRCWKNASSIVVNALQERDATTLHRPLYTTWAYKQRWSMGGRQCSIMSITQMPSQCEAILSFANLFNVMFGVTTATTWLEFEAVLVDDRRPHLASLCGLNVAMHDGVDLPKWYVPPFRMREDSWWQHEMSQTAIEGRALSEPHEGRLGRRLRLKVSMSPTRVTWTLGGTHHETLEMIPRAVRFFMLVYLAGTPVSDLHVETQESYAGPGDVLEGVANCAFCDNSRKDMVECFTCGCMYCSRHGGACTECDFVGCGACIANHQCVE